MEGSRHEKVVLVILAYIIGFCTAFVWFAADDHDTTQERYRYEHKKTDTAQAHTQTSNRNANTADVTSTATRAATPTDPYTTYKNGELRLHHEGNTILLSVAISSLQTSATAGEPGIHASLPAHSVSPDNQFVHFCEGDGKGSCQHYIYDIEAEVVRPVRSSDGAPGEVLVTQNDIAAQSEWNDSRLVVDGYHSDEGDPVWMLHHH